MSTPVHQGISLIPDHTLVEIGVVTNSNVTLIDEVSGVLGLGFPRLSEIDAATPNGAWYVRGVCPHAYPFAAVAATPFLATLSQQGILDYPIFGLLLTLNSTGSLALGGAVVLH